MTSSLRIVVTGLIGQYPLGGVTWDYLQYVLGLRDLGHDVYYLEDTGQWPYTPATDGVGKDCDYTVGYLSELFDRFGFEPFSGIHRGQLGGQRLVGDPLAEARDRLLELSRSGPVEATVADSERETVATED